MPDPCVVCDRTLWPSPCPQRENPWCRERWLIDGTTAADLDAIGARVLDELDAALQLAANDLAADAAAADTEDS
jgi:hypothetical protein